MKLSGIAAPECVGQVREVKVANTAGFYSVIPNEPSNKISLANNGMGSFLGWSKARFWKFENGVCALYEPRIGRFEEGVRALYESDTEQTPEHLIIAFKLLD